ncbi:GAS domain-containing protein, partial [Nephila pilipes]
MPPKGKKKEKEVVEGYDVKVMTLSELKEYACMLERDIETMRYYRNLYEITEGYLGDAYRKRQEELKLKDEQILAKDIEMERLRWSDLAKEELVAHQASETAFKFEEEYPKQEQDLMKEKIRRELKLEAEGKFIKIQRKTVLEKKKLRDIETKKNFLEKTIEPFVAVMEEGKQLTRLVSETIQAEALENSRKVFRNVCSSYKQKLHEYYKHLIRQDLEDIKNAKCKAEKLEATIQSAESQLQETDQKNALKKATNHQKGLVPVRYETNSITELKLEKNTAMDRLKEENAVLLEQIQSFEKEIAQLKKNFTPVLYKVRQSA